MQVINWMGLVPCEAEIVSLQQVKVPTKARKLRQKLVEEILKAFPWKGRADLISFFSPSKTYQTEEWVALPVIDPKKIHPMTWHAARVTQAQSVENPSQDLFQVLRLDFPGGRKEVAASVSDANFILLDISTNISEDLEWHAAWVADNYEKAIQVVLKRIIQSGRLAGRFDKDTFIPENISALDASQLTCFFARLTINDFFVNTHDILKGIPELADLPEDTALILLRSALSNGGFYPLGGDRWTTNELFDQLNRDVPRGLPVPRIRSKLPIWTKEDERDLGGIPTESVPHEVSDVLKDLEEDDDTPVITEPEGWKSPTGPIRLPTLSYLHITQAYFPVSHQLQAFAPEVRMVYIQFIEGEYQPFILDRHEGLLKALFPDGLRGKILEEGIPAGTYLWLEYQGRQNYRIAPRPLAYEHMVPCKLAQYENGKLRIEHAEIPMRFEGDPSIFKADMRFEDIEALFAEANRVNLSVRDTIIFAVKELCKIDLKGRAYWRDIFNTVFLKRMCSPHSVSILLYTQPCFEKLGERYFRFIENTPEMPITKKPITRRKTQKAPKPSVVQKSPPIKVPSPLFHGSYDADTAIITTPKPKIEEMAISSDTLTVIPVTEDVKKSEMVVISTSPTISISPVVNEAPVSHDVKLGLDEGKPTSEIPEQRPVEAQTTDIPKSERFSVPPAPESLDLQFTTKLDPTPEEAIKTLSTELGNSSTPSILAPEIVDDQISENSDAKETTNIIPPSTIIIPENSYLIASGQEHEGEPPADLPDSNSSKSPQILDTSNDLSTMNLDEAPKVDVTTPLNEPIKVVTHPVHESAPATADNLSSQVTEPENIEFTAAAVPKPDGVKDLSISKIEPVANSKALSPVKASEDEKAKTITDDKEDNKPSHTSSTPGDADITPALTSAPVVGLEEPRIVSTEETKSELSSVPKESESAVEKTQPIKIDRSKTTRKTPPQDLGTEIAAIPPSSELDHEHEVINPMTGDKPLFPISQPIPGSVSTISYPRRMKTSIFSNQILRQIGKGIRVFWHFIWRKHDR